MSNEFRVTVYYTYELRSLYDLRVTSHSLDVSYKLVSIARVTSYFLTISYHKDEDYKDVMIMMLR